MCIRDSPRVVYPVITRLHVSVRPGVVQAVEIEHILKTVRVIDKQLARVLGIHVSTKLRVKIIYLVRRPGLSVCYLDLLQSRSGRRDVYKRQLLSIHRKRIIIPNYIIYHFSPHHSSLFSRKRDVYKRQLLGVILNLILPQESTK